MPFHFRQFGRSRCLLAGRMKRCVFLRGRSFRHFIGKRLSVRDRLFCSVRSGRVTAASGIRSMISVLTAGFHAGGDVLHSFASLRVMIPALHYGSDYVCYRITQGGESSRSTSVAGRATGGIIGAVFRSPSPYVGVRFRNKSPSASFSVIGCVVRRTR